PLKYSTLQSYDIGLENMMSLGPSFIRFLGKIVLWSITQLYKIIPNYGIVIIVFSILVKLVLHPLTKKSYQSMKEMQKVQPLMQEIKEKYSKDPQKMNAEVMKLYKEHGVNPLGGCLPMLLQLPLLYALFEVFRTTIEFRGAPFVGWINDLSGPDTLTTIPFFDMPLNVLPLVMGLTMFLQQKSTITDPKQKVMVYMMPGIMTFFFYTFPSGLNLYYTLFNLLTIAHQRFIPDSKKKINTKKKEKSNPKTPNKPSKKKMSRMDMMRQISKNR
ncbi:MAG: membrane protein insertase YidC, partial [bacterium]